MTMPTRLSLRTGVIAAVMSLASAASFAQSAETPFDAVMDLQGPRPIMVLGLNTTGSATAISPSHAETEMGWTGRTMIPGSHSSLAGSASNTREHQIGQY